MSKRIFREKICDKPSITFAGCGFVGIYHVGVATCLKLFAPHLLQNKIGGSSAGAMCALTLLCDIPLVDIARNVVMLAFEANKYMLGSFSPDFSIHELLKTFFETVLPDNVAEIVSGKLFVSLTQMRNTKNILVSEFRDKNDVIEAVCASSFVPFMSGITFPKFRGEYALDGGCSDNLPVLGEQTITVCPFTGDASICPTEERSEKWGNFFHGTGGSVHVSKNNLWRFKDAVCSSNIQALESLFAEGFSDASRFLLSTNRIKCQQCLENKKSLSEKCKNCDIKRKQFKSQNEIPKEICDMFKEILEMEMKMERRSLMSSIWSLASWAKSQFPTSFNITNSKQRSDMLYMSLVSLKYLFDMPPSIQSCPFVNF